MLRLARLAAFCWLAGMGALPAASAATPERLAVVVGNQDYATVADLANARSDAEKIAAMLRGMGFTVFDAYDVDRRRFEDLLRHSILNVRDGAEIVFFYAGHGIQIGRRNYLLPTDVAFDSIYDLPVESVTLDRVIELLSSRGTVHVAIIDACRDNPFPNVKLAGNLDASLFETKSGFEVFQTPLNSLVAFSTAPGMLAFDGEGENSPYASAILEVVRNNPRDEAQAIFSKVRQTVFEATDGKQVPWESSTLVTPFRFLREDTRGLMPVQANDVAAPATAEPTGETAQNRTSAAETGDGGATASTPAPVSFPAAVTLEVEYDRVVDFGAALAHALGTREAFDVAVTDPPDEGAVGAGEAGSLTYEPVLTERRSDSHALSLSARFGLEVSQGDVTQDVQVTLDMRVNGCDLAAGDALDTGGVGYFRLPNEIEVGPALALCREAVSRNPGVPRFVYQLGRAEQAAGRLEAAFVSYRKAAEAGYVRAKHGMARLLSSDRIDRDVVDIPLDMARANALFDEAIAAGDPFAIHSRGFLLLRNGETRAERERGFDLLNRSAELGHTYSMNELGVYFLTKDGAHFLPERGMRYLEASAERDDIYGYHNLGFVALFGLDGQKDLAEARDWFEKAALGGHPKSPAAIGRMIVQGQTEGSAEEALKWYDMGLERGDGWGGANGAYLILNGDVEAPRHQGLIRAAKAAHLQDDEAAKTARQYLDRASSSDLGRAVQVLLNELGEDLAVDGVVGPATRRVLAARAGEHGIEAPPRNGREQLLTAAKIYWAERPTRPDLF